LVNPPPKIGLFGRVAGTVMRLGWRMSLLLALISTLAVLGASQLRVDPNILELLPPDDPTTQAIQALNAQEGGANLLTIAVAGQSTEQVASFARELAEALQAKDTVDYALYELDPDLAWQIGLLQLEPAELTLIEERMSAALALGPGAANPFIAARLLDLGPLTEKLAAGSQTNSLSSGGGATRVIVRPVGSAYDPQFARPFMADLHALLDSMEPESRGVQIPWIGGAYRHTVEDLEGIIHDLGWTATASFVFVLTLIAVAFRDPRAVLLIFVPLLMGTAWTFGYAWLSVGTLTTFTSYAGAVLIGLGVDFAVHLYSRYREERALGLPLEDAVVRAWDQAGPPCLAAALTSAGGFLALWAAGFQGFQQLGTILAGGVLLCLAAVILGLPLLIKWRENAKASAPLRKVKPPPEGHSPTYKLAPLGLMAAASVTVLAIILLPRVGFEFDMSELRRDGMSYADLSEQERALAVDSYAPVVVSYPDAVTLSADHTRLSTAMDEGRIPRIASILSLHSVIPSDQDVRVAQLQRIAELSRDDNLRFLPGQVQQNLRRIREADPRALKVDDLPRGLQHVLGAADGHHRLLIMPSGNMWDLRETAELYDTVQRWIPEHPKAGEYLATSVLYRLVEGDAPRVAGIALIVVFVFTALDLRSVRRGAAAVAALAAGMAWAGAGLALFRIDLSMANFVGIPILMGIGVDVVIHMLHRLKEEGPGRIRYALQTTGWAAGLSAATTIVSFASLSLASSNGVQSLGLLIVLGLTLVTLAAFVVLPLGWMTTWKLSGELDETNARRQAELAAKLRERATQEAKAEGD